MVWNGLVKMDILGCFLTPEKLLKKIVAKPIFVFFFDREDPHDKIVFAVLMLHLFISFEVWT